MNNTVLSIEEEIKYHLEYNSSVPPPAKHIDALVSVCIEGIENVNNDDFDAWVDLPKGVRWHSLFTEEVFDKMPSYEVVRIFELIPWLREDLINEPDEFFPDEIFNIGENTDLIV